MDLAIGFFLGFFALPWMWMGALTLLFIVDVVLCENEAFGWGTFLVIVGTGLVAWLGGDVNVLSWTWNNLAEIFKFLIFYFMVGGLWSIAKWYFFLLKVREKVRSGAYDRAYRSDESTKNKRPEASYAKNNKGRIMGWIGHWPFSMIGSLFGDVLKRIVENIFNVLKSLYDRIGNHVFSGFEE